MPGRRIAHVQKPKQRDGSWPIAYRWMAMGTLVAYSAIGSRTIVIAHAQQQEAGTVAPARPARFDIAAATLGAVLADFEKASGIHASWREEGIGALASPGVVGFFTPEEALKRILTGVGLHYRFVSRSEVRLELEGPVATVDVYGQSAGIVSPKYAETLHETPQSISTVSRETMEQQGTATLRDALRNVSGISLAAGEGGAQGDNLTIRGFTARNDLFLDGMRDFGSYYRDPFNTEEVEVVQGPSSAVFGRGSTGGVVNMRTKSPGNTPHLSGDAEVGTDATRRVALDWNQPLAHMGTGAAFRLNVMGDQGGVAERDVAENRRFGVAPSLAFGLGTLTRVNLSYLHQTADDNPDYGIPWLFNQPAPVNRENYYGFQKGNFLRTYDDIGTARIEHDFASHFSLREQVRFANYARNALITEAQIPAGLAASTPLSSISVTRHEIGVNSVESSLDEQLDLTAHFQTGPFMHTLTMGVEGGRETSDPTRPTYSNVPTTSLLAPDPSQALSGSVAITSKVTTTAKTAAAYVLDSIRFGKWNLSGGLRWERFDADYTQSIAPVAAFHRVDQMPSWRAALTYDISQTGNVYAAAGDSFNPSAESLSLSASTANLPPEKNRSYEFGSKWDLARHALSLRGAIFRTEKLNAREPDPNNPVLNVLAGDQRVNGAQIEVRGHLTSRWEILTSYAYMDGKVASSQYYPAAVGARLANVPANTFNFWTEYRLPSRWETGFGGNFVSSRTSSSTAPLDPATGLVKQAPSYWLFNAMLKRRITEHVELQLNVANLANRYYYDQLHPAHVILGPGRSAMFGVHYKF